MGNSGKVGLLRSLRDAGKSRGAGGAGADLVGESARSSTAPTVGPLKGRKNRDEAARKRAAARVRRALAGGNDLEIAEALNDFNQMGS